LIVLHQSLVRVIFHILGEWNRTEEPESIWINAVRRLNKVIKDVRIANAFNVTLQEGDHANASYLDKDIISAIDLYVSGKYEECLVKSKKLLRSNPDCFELYLAYLKSLLHCDQNFINAFDSESVSGKVLWYLRCALLKNDETFDAISDLHKLLYTIGWSPLTCRLSAFVYGQFSVSNFPYRYTKFSALNTTFTSSDLALYINDKKGIASYFSAIDEGLNEVSSNSVLAKKILSDIHDSHVVSYKNSEEILVEPYYLKLYEAEVLQAKSQYQEAYEAYEHIKHNKLFEKDIKLLYNYEEIYYNQFVCLIEQEDFIGAVELAVSILIENQNLSYKFKSAKLIDTFVSGEFGEFKSVLQIPIYLNFYQAKTEDIYIALDNFLCELDISFPHQLKEFVDKFDGKELAYLLQNICKQEVFSSSYYYSNQEALDNERIEVCLLLAEINSVNKKDYFQEISEITRGILIRKGIRQIDESKIYVDVSGIRKSSDKDLRETFHRYLELASFPMEQIAKLAQEETVLVPYFSNAVARANSKGSDDSEIQIASYSRFNVFKDMYLKIRDKFIASNEFGLDTYLSTRIRHGTLLGHIRHVFEKYYLVTKKDSSTGTYLPNEYWHNELNLYSYEGIDTRVDEILGGFSSRVDTLADNLKNIQIQVSTERKITNGLFNYAYEEYDLLDMFTNKYGSVADYDLFFDAIVDELWVKTEKNLLNVRQNISNKFKNDVLELLGELRDSINTLNSENKYHDYGPVIRNIVRCQTDITVELERISSWFQRTNSSSINEFDVSVPLDASMQVVRRIYPVYKNLTADVKNTSVTVFEGEVFSQFADMMQILLENIIKHSNLPEELLDVHIELADQDAHKLSLKIKNNINAVDDLENIRTKISSLDSLFSNQISDDIIRTEKGSGYPKLKKILYNDLKCEYAEVKFAYCESTDEFEYDTFEVMIDFDAKHILKRNNSPVTV
jgi:hypothetical protein